MSKSEDPNDPWHVYMVRCDDGSLYTGITTDVERRFSEHRSSPKAAKFLRGKGPLELAYQCEIGAKELALRIEYRLKKLPKQKKEQLVTASPLFEQLLRLVDIETG